jgi:AcrR family transcriptional regulator
LTKYGYEAMTVKNICQEAGVTNGSFYHFFDSKDAIYSYFLLRNHTDYIDTNEERLNTLNVKERIKDLYIMHVRLCVNLGLQFTAAYYSTSNGGLDSIHRKKEPGYYYIQDKCEEYLIEAQRDGLVYPEVNTTEVRLMLATIATGVMFHWSVTKGYTNVEKQLNTLMDCYLNSILTDKFRELYGES